jgi:orotidine 5'-phosphate decarboxylase subfamily 2
MFYSWLSRKIRENDSILCVGLDPPLDLAEDLESFGRRIVDATAELACCCKPNSAFFEARGAAGWEALARTIAYAHAADLPVILDCKRADIGNTAEAYAHAAFVTLGADAVTVNPYLGADGIAPFARAEGKGIFVLCRTSNPSGPELQALECDGEPLYRIVARHAVSWAGGGAVGLVMGATFVEPIAEIRRLLPSVWFLIPGIGAQGGSMEAVRAGVNRDGSGVLVNVSRLIIADPDPASRAAEVRASLNRHREPR